MSHHMRFFLQCVRTWLHVPVALLVPELSCRIYRINPALPFNDETTRMLSTSFPDGWPSGPREARRALKISRPTILSSSTADCEPTAAATWATASRSSTRWASGASWSRSVSRLLSSPAVASVACLISCSAAGRAAGLLDSTTCVRQTQDTSGSFFLVWPYSLLRLC